MNETRIVREVSGSIVGDADIEQLARWNGMSREQVIEDIERGEFVLNAKGQWVRPNDQNLCTECGAVLLEGEWLCEEHQEESAMNPVVENYMERRRNEGDLGTEGMLVEDVQLMAKEAQNGDLRDFLTAVIDGVPDQDDPEPVVEFEIPERLHQPFYALMIEIFDNV